MTSKAKVSKVVPYGPVDLIIEPDCHRFESRFTFERGVVVFGGLLGAGMAVFVAALLAKSRGGLFVYMFAPLFAFLSLCSIWFLYLGLWMKAVLSFTPAGITLKVRGVLPMPGSGDFFWELEQLSGVD